MLNAKNVKGMTALHKATINRKEEVVDFMVSKGADPNVQDVAGRTPLHWAIFFGHRDLVRYFLGLHAKEKINLELKDACGFTPKELAMVKGKTAIAREIAFVVNGGDVADLEGVEEDEEEEEAGKGENGDKGGGEGTRKKRGRPKKNKNQEKSKKKKQRKENDENVNKRKRKQTTEEENGKEKETDKGKEKEKEKEKKKEKGTEKTPTKRARAASKDQEREKETETT